FGSASIGALRAAELLPFGMEGVGAVFELYRDGIFEDDDEVALAHGPAETGFVSASEAMVNIRQTLRKAERLGIISTELRVSLEKIGKGLFYPDRNYSTVLRHALENGSSQPELTRLQQWLPNHRVNQKRDDALLMLRVIRDQLEQGLRRKTVSYSFEQTAMWQSAQRQAGELRFDSNGYGDSVTLESLLDELRLEGPKYKEHRNEALRRFVGLTYGELLRWYFEKVLGHTVPADIDKYARDLGFASPDAFRRALLREYLYQRYERRNETSSERFG